MTTFSPGDVVQTTRGVRWSSTGKRFNTGDSATIVEVIPAACPEDGLPQYTATINGQNFTLCGSLLEEVPPPFIP